MHILILKSKCIFCIIETESAIRGMLNTQKFIIYSVILKFLNIWNENVIYAIQNLSIYRCKLSNLGNGIEKKLIFFCIWYHITTTIFSVPCMVGWYLKITWNGTATGYGMTFRKTEGMVLYSMVWYVISDFQLYWGLYILHMSSTS